MLTTQRSSAKHLAFRRYVRSHLSIFCCLLNVSLWSGCDDEVPVIAEQPRARVIRDAMMEITPFEDYSVAGSSAGERAGDMAGGSLAGETGGSVAGEPTGGESSSCTSGDVRLLSECGVERCLNGTWTREQNSSERCNDHDDDCDGRVDESFSIGGMCFIDDAQGCRLEGEYICDPNTEAAMCMATSDVSTRPEVCDGVDNDCDQRVDEGFEDGPQCCTDASQCTGGVACVEGICQETNPNEPPIDPNAPLGTCGRPIWMPGFNIYSADGNSATKSLSVINCTQDDFDNGVLFLQTALGSEVVFAFSLPETRRVRFSVELSFFAPVIYVFEGQCSSERIESQYCDQSILGLGDEPPRAAELTFEAQADQLYYVVLDTKLDLLEIAEITGGGNAGSVPFVLNFSAAP